MIDDPDLAVVAQRHGNRFQSDRDGRVAGQSEVINREDLQRIIGCVDDIQAVACR